MTGFFSKLNSMVRGTAPNLNGRPSPKAMSATNGNAGTLGHNSPQETAPADGGGKAPKTAQVSFKRLYTAWPAWIVMGVLAGGGGVAIAGVKTIQDIRRDLPAPQEALTFVRDGTLTIKASDGAVLQQLGPATREKLTFDQIPPQLVEAFVASEDKNFYNHGGVDYTAIVRATLANLSAGEVVEGASTITQQLARIVFLSQERTLDRKLREALMAHKMEAELTKEQILERYLNLVYLGSGAYGVADAAWIYFSKSVDELTLSEMALIAGLAPAPSDYSPLVDEAAALQRRDLVLDRMVEAGFITSQERSQAMATPLTLNPSTPRNLYSQVPYFTSYVQQQLPTLIDADEIEAGGLTVETTLNLKWQEMAQDTVNKAIANYGRGQRFSQAALVAIDPRTGEIKALVGGNDFLESQFNRVTQAQRQPGSTFKTFVYTTAIAAGFSPYKSYMDAKLVVDGYEPQNYSRNYSGSQSMRNALVQSINIIAVKALIEVGWDPIIEVAQKMGIKSKLLPTYSLALGSSEVNLLELTSAYGTLAARGKHIEPHGITRIINRKGDVIYEATFEAEQAVDQTTADIMTWMLRGVVTSGTGGNAALRDRPVAGKTGTSELKRDLWFIGYIPQMVTGVWLGNDNNRPTAGASSTAARVWRNFMVQVAEEIPSEAFPQLPRLSGRERTVTARPLKPRRMVAARGATNESESDRREQERSAPASREETPSESATDENKVIPRREPDRRQSEPANDAAPSTPSDSPSTERPSSSPPEAPPEPASSAPPEPAPPPPAPEPPPPAPPEPAPPPASRPSAAPEPASGEASP